MTNGFNLESEREESSKQEENLIKEKQVCEERIPENNLVKRRTNKRTDDKLDTIRYSMYNIQSKHLFLFKLDFILPSN